MFFSKRKKTKLTLQPLRSSPHHHLFRSKVTVNRKLNIQRIYTDTKKSAQIHTSDSASLERYGETE